MNKLIEEESNKEIKKSQKKKLVNKLKKLNTNEENFTQECRKARVNKRFVDNYLHDKLNIISCNLNKALINNYTTISQQN